MHRLFGLILGLFKMLPRQPPCLGSARLSGTTGSWSQDMTDRHGAYISNWKGTAEASKANRYR